MPCARTRSANMEMEDLDTDPGPMVLRKAPAIDRALQAVLHPFAYAIFKVLKYGTAVPAGSGKQPEKTRSAKVRVAWRRVLWGGTLVSRLRLP